MNRSILYDQEQGRDFDFLGFEHDVLLGLGFSVQDILGQTTTVISGFAATPTGPATLTINLAAGRCYQQADADATAVGDIPQDTSVIEQQGFYAGATVTLVPPAVAGHSQWNLIEAQFSQSDVVRAGDPNGGIPPFYNSANPSEPLNGQGNLGDVSPTERASLCIIQVIQGVSATTGSEAPPSPTSGWVPLYLVDLTNGQTQITSGEILVAGPSVGLNVPSNYPYAPFLAGLLSAHHSGNPGQAPQIDLTKEVKNLLPPANGGAPPHGVQTFTSSGTFTVPAGVTSVSVELWGGGGGSGGAVPNNAGSGGAGGGYANKLVTGLTPGSTVAVTVGVGGAAGGAGGGNGGAGGASSFGAFVSATGGGGGPGNSTASSSGGSGTGGDLVFLGQPGNGGSIFSSTTVMGGGGGGSPRGAEGQQFSITSSLGAFNGTAGVAPGGGANGAASASGSGGNVAGAAGGGGAVVVRW